MNMWSIFDGGKPEPPKVAGCVKAMLTGPTAGAQFQMA
jgi:hypothetical protein